MSFEQFGLQESVSKMVPKPMGLCRKLNFVDTEDENMNHSYEEALNSSGVSSEGIVDFAESAVVTSSPIDKERERQFLCSPGKSRFPCGFETYRTTNPPMSPPYKRVKNLRLSEEPNTPKTLFERCVDQQNSVLSHTGSAKKLAKGLSEKTLSEPATNWGQLAVTLSVDMIKKARGTPVPAPVFSRQKSLRSKLPAFAIITPPDAEKLPSPPANQFTPKGAENPKKRTRSKTSLNESSTTKEESCDNESDDEQPCKRIALHDSNISRYHKEFHEMRKIGSGQFGTVYICRNRLDGCDYAIKKSLKPVAGSADEKMAIREVQAHAILGKHPHVVRYYSAWAEDDHMIIQNEYCNGGSLADEVEERKKCGKAFSESELKDIMTQLAEGLRYIHSMHLVHLDIKPGNIFISRETRYDSADDGFEDEDAENDEATYKIGDLGHVTALSDPQVEEGDCRYLPFEILQDNFQHLHKADVFSLGLTIYELASSSALPKNGDLWQKIRQEGFLPKLNNISQEFHNLILSTIKHDPTLRPSAVDLLHSSVLSGYSRNSTEQLRRELRAERLKNQALRKQLMDQMMVQPMPTPKRSQRLVGKNMAKSHSSMC